MNIKLVVMAWVVAVALAQATPIALEQKLGAVSTNFQLPAPCDLHPPAISPPEHCG